MTRFVIALLAGLVSTMALAQSDQPRPPRNSPERGQDVEAVAPGPSPQQRAERYSEATRAKLLDQLFEKLKDASSPEESKMLGEAISALFLRSGSPTIDLMMVWAADEMAHGDKGRALDYLDAIVALAPDDAEAYFRRAAVHYAMRNFGKALDDLNKTLVLEPRHYEALAGLGAILRDLDRPKEALAAYRAAQALNPQMESAKKAIETLSRRVEGRDS